MGNISQRWDGPYKLPKMTQLLINLLSGTFPYHATTATVDRIGSIHEHANNIRVVGMGELVVVLNGLEFRTRHNDYKLVQPEETESGSRIEYDAVRDIPFPEVPKAVTEKEDIQAQVRFDMIIDVG